MRIKLLAFILCCLAFLLPGCQSAVFEQAEVDDSILFKDDFSSPDSQWDDYQDSAGGTIYQDGKYRIFINQPASDFWANPDGLSFSDTKISVEASRLGGSANNIFGILCRYQDPGNFYQLLVSSDGYFDISKVKDGQRVALTGEQLAPSEAIPLDQGLLLLRADCIEDRLSLYVGGELIAEANDSDFASGNIGLLAGAFEEAGTDIAFDNLLVEKP
jgi:hypothetical protein